MANKSRSHRTITYNVAEGDVVADVSTLDAATAVARQGELEQQLAATLDDPSRSHERRHLLAEHLAVSRRLSELKEQAKQDNTRNLAGIGSPLHEAIVARLDAALVAEIEADAMARLAERERRSAELGAGKSDDGK